MAAPVGAVRAEISASAIKFYSEMERVRASARKTGSSFGDMGKNLQGLGKSRETFAALVGGLTGVGGKAGVAASKLAELAAGGITPVAIGITAVTTGLALWLNRGAKLDKLNEDLAKSQQAFANSLALTNAELRDLQDGTATAPLLKMRQDIAAAKAEMDAAQRNMFTKAGGGATVGENVKRTFGWWTGASEESQKAFQEARERWLKLTDDLAAEEKKQGITTAKVVGEARTRELAKSESAITRVTSALEDMEHDLANAEFLQKWGEDAGKVTVEMRNLQRQFKSLLETLPEADRATFQPRVEEFLDRRVEYLLAEQQAKERAARDEANKAAGEERQQWGAQIASNLDREAESQARVTAELTSQAAAREDIVASLEAEGERRRVLSSLSGRDRELRELEMERRDVLEQLGPDATFEQRDRVVGEFEKRKQELTEGVKQVKSAASDLKTSVAGSISTGIVSSLEAATSGTKKFGAAMKDVARSVAADLVRMTLKAIAFKAVMTVLNLLPGGAALSATANATAGGGAAGGQGLSLLQPKASGFNVNIINNTGAGVTQSQRTGPGGSRELEIVIGQSVARDIAGGGPAWRAIQAATGLKRSPRGG